MMATGKAASTKNSTEDDFLSNYNTFDSDLCSSENDEGFNFDSSNGGGDDRSVDDDSSSDDCGSSSNDSGNVGGGDALKGGRRR